MITFYGFLLVRDMHETSFTLETCDYVVLICKQIVW